MAGVISIRSSGFYPRRTPSPDLGENMDIYKFVRVFPSLFCYLEIISCYLIPKLLHTLRYLKNKSYLSSFWISIVKKHRMRRLSTGVIHVQKKAVRHKRPVPESVRNEIVELYRKYRISASYNGKILKAKGLHIRNEKINQVLKEVGFAMSEPKKWHRKKWIRYERENSNSLWHVDWHEMKDPRWKGLWLIVYEYSSRFIVGYGVYPTPASKFFDFC